jgi:site-specific DNA recombinase
MRTPSRGSRTMSDWVAFLDLCREREILVHVTQHGRTYDTANYHDREALMNAGASAEADADERAETVREGIETAMRAGKPLATVAYGLRKVYDGPKQVRMETDPEKAAQVLALFTLVDQGHAVSRACRETGISRGHAGFILKNMSYIARRVMPDGEVIECQWPAIVPEPMFYRVQAILAAVPESAAQRGRPKSTYRSLLGGLAVCGKCGAAVTTHIDERKTLGKVRRYRCAKGCFKLDHVSEVDERVGWEVVKYLLTPGVLERHLPEGDAAAAAAARGEAEALRAELAEWAADLEVSRAAYKAREAKLLPLIEAAEQRARQLSIPPAVRGFADRLGFEDGDATADRLNAAMQVWDDMPMEAARALLREVADVVVYPQAMARELGCDRVEVLFRETGEVTA